MLLLLLRSAVAATSSASVFVPTPIYQANWITASDYPPQAIRQGVERAASYRPAIDAAGKPTACQVTEPSGRPTLDPPTCDLMLQRAHFVPATDDNGKPIASAYPGRIRWKLPSPRSLAPPVMVSSPGVAGVRTVQDVIASLRLNARPTFALPVQPQFDKTPDPVEDAGAAAAPPTDPRVLFGTLPNGLRYAILANNTPHGAVSFRSRIGVGLADEAPGRGAMPI